jgi:DNA (cytosine-5)-methyltransferase 1
MGYARAGFDVVGVDIVDQPNYPFEFIQMDALAYLSDWISWRYRGFDAIHASPPCQAYSAYRRKGHGIGDGYPDLIAATRDALEATDLPYIIENVSGAPLRDPVMLCGSSFALDVRRHRVFESNVPLEGLPCAHDWQRRRGKQFPGATNRNGRYTVEVGVYRIPLYTQKQAMGIEWEITRAELSQAVPPAYTCHLGRQLRDHARSLEVAV